MEKRIVLGDFTDLAKNYKNRAGYSGLVVRNLINYIGITQESSLADVGAGTGKFTQELLSFEFKKLYAVEPNDSMRAEGIKYVVDDRIEWISGAGENTGLTEGSVEWVIMASSFHWVDTEAGLKEFSRILKPGGYFTAIWNPRDIGSNELHKKIEDEIYKIAPNIVRKSSGSGEFTKDLDVKLAQGGYFKDVIYVEAKNNEQMTKERYMGIWNSVNDIPSQAGPEKWKEILSMIEQTIDDLDQIEVPYVTRSWTAQKKD